MTAIVDSYRLHDAQMRQGNGFGGASATEDVAAVATMMFPVGEGELFPAAHANVRVDPFGGLRGEGAVSRVYKEGEGR